MRRVDKTLRMMIWTMLFALTAAPAFGSDVDRPAQQSDGLEPNWPAEPFQYVVLRQDLRRYLREFARWSNVFLRMDRAVQGTVQGPLPTLPPAKLLDHLSAEHGLFWYFDGVVLHIGPADALVTESQPLPPERVIAAERALKRLDLLVARFPARLDAITGFITVTGPKPYVTRVMTIARSADVGMLAVAPNGDWRRVTIYRRGEASAVRVRRRLDGPLGVPLQ